MSNRYPSARFLTAFILALTLTAAAEAADREFAYPPDISLTAVQAWVDKAPKEHPRLLANQAQLDALRQSLDDEPLRREVARAVIRHAELIQDIPPITRTLQGRRLLSQSRRCVDRVLTLSMAYHLTRDPKYAVRCRQEMLAAARFSDWNPSHFLDVGEMTFALAIGYDWLFDQLDEPSRKEIRTAIIQKGVILPFETRHRGWIRSRNNWGQVCHGGLTAGALAVMEDQPELAARTVHNALHNVTNSMRAYAPNGSYPEGPGYWAYGTSYNVLLIGVLESVFGVDFGLSKAPGFSRTGEYINLVSGPSGLFFNYADGGASRGLQPALFWFAARYHRPDWLQGERERWMSVAAMVSRRTAGAGRSRLAALALLWMNGLDGVSAASMPLHWSSGGETPITIHRSSWTDPNATYIGFKGGSPSASHGQMDTGSFVLDADGVRWAVDLGAEGYHAIESRGMNLWSRAQNSDRWTIFRQSNDGHNTLVIDGQPQIASGHAKLLSFSDQTDFPHSVLDLSSVYAGQVKSAHRGVTMLPSGEVLIQDELTGLAPGSRVRWGMITPGEPGETGSSMIRLRQRDAALGLTILSPDVSTWRTIDTATPRNEWDSANRGTRMVAFEATVPPSGELVLAVLATPGSCHTSMKTALKPRPLASWSQQASVTETTTKE